MLERYDVSSLTCSLHQPDLECILFERLLLVSLFVSHFQLLVRVKIELVL